MSVAGDRGWTSLPRAGVRVMGQVCYIGSMQFLELRVPPVAQLLIAAAVMWGTARLTPALRFSLEISSPVAALLVAVCVALWNWGTSNTKTSP